MLSRIPKHGKRAMALATAFSVLSVVPAFAAVALPDAGQTLGTLKNNQVTLPGKADLNVETDKNQSNRTQQNKGPKFHVTSIHITGQDVYKEAVLLPLVKDAQGKDVTLADLNKLADKISKYFHDQGYLVAAAYIPAQSIQNGTVEIKVVVGKYGKIEVKNTSELVKSRISAFLSNLKSGDYVKRDSLERALLLLNDTSGISVKANLAPGKAQGTTDLKVEVKNSQKIVGTVSLDNYGNCYTGNDRSNLSITVNNLDNIGDALTLSGINAGSNMNNFGASYQVPVGAQGGQLGAEYARTRYFLGDEFLTLGASGTATVESLYFTQPIVRSRAFNLYGRVGFDHKILHDAISSSLYDDDDGNNYVNDKQDNIYHVGLMGNQYDAQGNGVTTFSLTQSSGKLSLNTPDVLTYDAYYAKTNGNFNKTNLTLHRQKYIAKRLSYSLSLNAQMASKNLDSSEKMFLGGISGVRAYPNGDAGGDSGAIFTGELHFDMPDPSLQLAVFIDNGRVTTNENNWDTSSINKRILTGAGFGFIWNNAKDYSIRLDCAWRLTDPLYGDNDTNGRIWLQAIKHF